MSVSIQGQAKLHRWSVWFLARKIAKELHIKKYTIAGSYRRGKRWCNDIDLLIPVSSTEEAEGIQVRLDQLGWKRRSQFFHDNLFGHLFYKRMGNKLVCLDIFLVPPGCMGNALLFATGSKQFNDSIRENIITMGYSWAHPPHFERIEDSIKVGFSTEKGALAFLGMEWVKPKNRL